jgi:hypothetical protein
MPPLLYSYSDAFLDDSLAEFFFNSDESPLAPF